MLGYIGYRAAGGYYRMLRRQRRESRQSGGRWTFTALLFTVLPFTVLAMCVAIPQRSAAFWAWLGVNTALVALAVASSGLLGRRQVLRKYGTPARHVPAPLPDRMRERAALLRELDGLDGQDGPGDR